MTMARHAMVIRPLYIPLFFDECHQQQRPEPAVPKKFRVMFTSVQFAEWGYHFNAEKPYGRHNSYPAQETNTIDCSNFLK